MKKILLILVSSIFFIGCGPCENRNSEATNSDIQTLSDGGNIKLLIPYNKTPRGISIITLNDGRKFIYAETKNGVAIQELNNITTNGE
jgi:hypothetical protein